MPENKINTTKKLPFALAIGSFVVLGIVSMTTNPQQSIASIPLFFIALWLTIFGTLWLIGSFIFNKKRPRVKAHIALITTAVVLFFMLKSTGEIRPIDTAVMLLLVSGLAFYINRRY